MKTKILILLPFLLLTGMVWGQHKKASITQLRMFTDKKDSLQPTLFWAQYDATRRGSMLYIDKNQRVRMLSENPPDAAIQSITEITAKVSGLKGDVGEAEAAFKAQKSIAELGKRTAAVNMLRDALYRLNELYYATTDEKKEIIQLLKDFNKEKTGKNTITETVEINSLPLFQTSIGNNDLKELFTKVIESVKDIAIEEAKTDVFKYQADKAEYEASIKKSEEEIKKYEGLILIIQKTQDNLTKEEADKYLKEIIKTQTK